MPCGGRGVWFCVTVSSELGHRRRGGAAATAKLGTIWSEITVQDAGCLVQE